MEMLSEVLNLILSHLLKNILQVQISRAMNSAINDRLIPAIQNDMGSMVLVQGDTESGTSTNNQDISVTTNGLNTKLTKKDSMSAFDLKDTADLSPYNTTGTEE